MLAAVDAGEAVRAVAPRFGVSISYVYKAVIRRRRSGEVAARTIRGRPPRKLAAPERAVKAFMRARQDATLADLRRPLLEAHGIAVSLGAAWRTVRRLGLALKTYGPPRLQGVGFWREWVVRKRIRHSGMTPSPRW